MFPIYWPHVLDSRGFTFRQGQEIFPLSEEFRSARLLHPCAFMELTWKRLMCIYSNAFSVSTIIRSRWWTEWISVKESWNVADKGNQKYTYSEISLSRYHFVHHRFYMDRPAIEPLPLQWEWRDLDDFYVAFTLFIWCIMTKWKNYVTPTNSPFCNLCVLSST